MSDPSQMREWCVRPVGSDGDYAFFRCYSREYAAERYVMRFGCWDGHALFEVRDLDGVTVQVAVWLMSEVVK